LFHRHFKPLAPPEAFNSLVIHLPARISQQGCDPTLAIAAILMCQLNHVCDQAFFVSTPLGQATLYKSVLAQNAAIPSFRKCALKRLVLFV
jgi:hypothetical protein